MARVGALLDQVAPVHVDADPAAIDLRDAQLHQLEQAFADGALAVGHRQVDHGFQVGGGQGEQVQACGHDGFLSGGEDALCGLLADKTSGRARL